MEKIIKEETKWLWMGGDLEIKHTKGDKLASIRCISAESSVIINIVIVEELIEALNEIRRAMPMPAPTMKGKNE